MSAATIRNTHGVILRYETGMRPRHDQSKHERSDRLRCALLRGERQIRDMRTMFSCLDGHLSPLALERLEFALRTVQAFLDLARVELGLQTREHDGDPHGE